MEWVKTIVLVQDWEMVKRGLSNVEVEGWDKKLVLVWRVGIGFEATIAYWARSFEMLRWVGVILWAWNSIWN